MGSQRIAGNRVAWPVSCLGLVAFGVGVLGVVPSPAGAAGAIGAAKPAEVELKLLAADGEDHDLFGHSVAVWGDTALVGARHAGGEPGAVYVFERDGDTWVESAKLTPADPTDSDFFGFSVSLFGDTAVVGAPGADWFPGAENNGAVYVFVREGGVWSEQAKLVPSGATSYRFLGGGVSLWGDTVLAGAPLAFDNGSNSGAAFVWVRQGETWTEEAKILPQEVGAGDLFGWVVSLWRDTALISASRDDDVEFDNGAAYVFERSGGTWTQEAKLAAADPQGGLAFGESVSLVEDTAVIGAFGDDTQGSESGSAYVFTRTGNVWTQQAKLLPSDGSPGAEFGSSVAISSGAALVGAPSDLDRGAAYRFVQQAGVWVEDEKLAAVDGESGDQFGIGVARNGATDLVGADLDDDNGEDAGAAWLFEPAPMEVSVAGSCPGDVTITVSGAPPNSEVGVVAAANTNGFVKGGVLCTGTVVEIGEPFQLPPLWIKVDGAGTGSRETTLEEGRCWVEAVALANCQTSDAVFVPGR